MKKRLRKTGEIVDVITYSKGIEHHSERGLNMWWDFEDVEEELTKEIDWGQLRIKAVVSALQGFASNPNITSVTDEELAKWSVSCADALIAELKKGGKDENNKE